MKDTQKFNSKLIDALALALAFSIRNSFFFPKDRKLFLDKNMCRMEIIYL